jgi:formylglycine-generating enzyme required for sulfatase activity
MEVAADLSAFWLASEERGAKTSSSASSTSEPSSDFGSGSQSWEAMTPSGVTGKVVGLNPLSRMWAGTLPAVWWTALAAAAVALFVAEAAFIYDWSTSSLKREIAEVQQELRASQTRVGNLEAENNALERENMRLAEVSDTLAEAEKTIERLSQEQKHTDAAMAELKQLRAEKEAMATASQPPSESQAAATENHTGTDEQAPSPQELLDGEVFTNSIGMKLRLIPAGTFTMGDATGFGNEKPPHRKPHRVTLTKPFYMGVHEVTNAQWKRVMWSVPSKWKDDDLPVEQVSLDDAVEFCRKLSALPEERKAGRVYRLPTEAEWEYACRAGTSTKFSFGDDEKLFGDYGWFDGNPVKQTHPVGQKKPNAWGLHDMHGNVLEWCSDWYEIYADGEVTNPEGPSSGSTRVYRGGCWLSSALYCRSASRLWNLPSYRDDILGFRLALSLPGSNPPASKDQYGGHQ